ncbi:hypothetical protein SJAV_01220 [Sulfurisphaera javensis]|uniref:Transmembrane protein n=1 Tax=Sulfurisphaera javensis TaxID=2049879 RepID=A0AAT9GN95_9CREN
MKLQKRKCLFHFFFKNTIIKTTITRIIITATIGNVDGEVVVDGAEVVGLFVVDCVVAVCVVVVVVEVGGVVDVVVVVVGVTYTTLARYNPGKVA